MIDTSCVKMDDICKRILEAMPGVSSGCSSMKVETIVSRVNADHSSDHNLALSFDEAQDRLEIMENTWEYVKTKKEGNRVREANLTAFGSQYLREFQSK
jgi:hypothetical protein